MVVLEIFTVQLDATTLDVVEPQQQVGNCALPAARVANQRYFRASWDFHVELIEYFRGASRVVEGDGLELVAPDSFGVFRFNSNNKMEVIVKYK